MSKLNPRGLAREPSIGIKSLLILSSKMHQRKDLLAGFLLSLLLFSVLSSVAQFQFFRVDAIIERSNGKAFTDSGIYNQNKLNSHSLVNLSSHIIPGQSVLADSLNKSLSGGLSSSLAFKGSEIEKNANANTITASNIANVTGKLS
ncbi:MAG TPA: hypothetical protein VH481_09200 [Nitrososphaeraceae archaeon]